MKPILFTLLVAFIGTTAFAQADTTQRTLFKNIKITSGGMYISAGASYGTFFHSNAIYTGFGGGGMINDHYRAGFEFETLVSNENVGNNGLVSPYTRMRWKYSSYGFNFDYSFFPKKIISINPGVLIGMATVSKHPLDAANYNADDELDDSNMFMLRPQLSINFNLFKFLSLKLGGGYRYNVGSRTPGIKDNQMSSPYAFAGLRFELGGPVKDW